jgi:hypothetical protein
MLCVLCQDNADKRNVKEAGDDGRGGDGPTPLQLSVFLWPSHASELSDITEEEKKRCTEKRVSYFVS